MRLHELAHVANVTQRIIGRVTRRTDDSLLLVEDNTEVAMLTFDGGQAPPSGSSTDVLTPWTPERIEGSGPMARRDSPPPASAGSSPTFRVTDFPTARPVGQTALPHARLHQLTFLEEGDVVSIDPTGFVRVLFRRKSPHNFILVTEQCNSLCLMCSQPPKQIDDSALISEHLRLVDLIDPATRELGITGGEPTLLRDGFLQLIARCRDRLPGTALHVLTNGRMFFYRSFAERLGAIGHPDLVLGIPLYSDVDSLHDHIVQARGAFEETVIGLQHLDRHDVRVEIRVVLHALTVPRLPQLAKFIARNFPFAFQVALMGLEMTGLVHKNLAELWIDPAAYQPQLREAAEVLGNAGVPFAIYNHQLCVLDPSLWPFARKSISDWKNVYLPECDGCTVLDRCGGFFQSGTRIRSAHIRPIRATGDRVA